MFPRNEATVDRAIRIIAGLALIAAFFLYPTESAWRWAFWLGLVPLVTGLVGSCPVYTLLGVSTCPVRRA